MATDFDDNEIAVGDTVIFPHSGGAGKLVKGKVLSISPKQVRIECTKGHAIARNFKPGESTAMLDVVSRNHEHVFIVKKA